FEEVAYLLWKGDLPNQAELNGFQQELAANRAVPDGLLALLRGFPPDALSMDALRTAISALGMMDPDTGDNSPEANLRKTLRLQPKVPPIAAAIERLSQGKEPIAPRQDLSLAGNFLYMLDGQDPEPLHTRTLDIDFILHADHELNASTFAARVTVGTLADLY